MDEYAWISLLAGFMAGICEVIVGFPFDTIKTRMQVSPKGGDGGPSYRGPWHCIITTLRMEGIAGFYRGIVPPLIQEAFGVAMLFGARDWLREHLDATLANPPALVLSCCIIGLAESVLYCPLDLLKARMQVKSALSADDSHVGRLGSPSPKPPKIPGAHRKHSHAEPDPAGMIRCAREVTKARGWWGLYSGYPIQVAKEMLGNVALFCTYDLVLSICGGADPNGPGHGHPTGQSWLAIWPAGSLAGMAYYLVNFPLDTIKTRLQTDSLANPKYRSSAHCVWKVTQQECTFFELYRGLSLCLARAVPGSAVQFFVFESCFRTFSEPGLLLVKIQNWPSMAELIRSAPERPIPRALQRMNATLIRQSLGRLPG